MNQVNNYRSELRDYFDSLTLKSETTITNWFEEFPDFALKALQEMNTAPLKDPQIVSQIIASHDWPEQHFKSATFADLSFTLFRNEHFFLDLYIWNHQDTNIHDHHFSGAFQVIQGESFHISYNFIPEEQLTPWLEKGRLKVVEKTNLTAGETRKIDFNDKFIHQNLHSTNPCLTLCLRTKDHPHILLNSYCNGGLKIGLYRSHINDIKALEAISYLTQFKNSSDTEITEIITMVSDHALYSIMNGQQHILTRNDPKIRTVIHNELFRRNPKQYMWFKEVVDKQQKLAIQLQSMFKIQA